MTIEQTVEELVITLQRCKNIIEVREEVGFVINTLVLDEYTLQILQGIYGAKNMEEVKSKVNNLIFEINLDIRTNFNFNNVNRWNENNYSFVPLKQDDLVPDSERFPSHLWGSLLPSTVHQLLSSYTSTNDWVLNPFLGSGISMLESKKLNRNFVGIELSVDIARKAMIQSNSFSSMSKSQVIVGNNVEVDYDDVLKYLGIETVQFILINPPSWDSLEYSKDPSDFANSKKLNEYFNYYEKLMMSIYPFLEPGKFCALVVGDKYIDGETIPLSLQIMQLTKKVGLHLKSAYKKHYDTEIELKNEFVQWREIGIEQGNEALKYDYIFVFQKPIYALSF